MQAPRRLLGAAHRVIIDGAVRDDDPAAEAPGRRAPPGAAEAEVKAQYATSRNLEARMALHARYGTAETSWFEWVFKLLDLAPGERVLEIGCGTGELWRSNRARVPAGIALTLTDASAGMVDRSRDVGPAAHRVTDAVALPFPAGSFDVVVANHMLYHVADPATAIAEAARVLAPGGRLIATTNGRGHLAELDALLARHAHADRWFDLATFSLDTGDGILRRSFGDVVRYRHDNHLRVTEPAPLVAYVESMCTRPESLDVVALRAEVATQIAREGAFVITTCPGAFVARLPHGSREGHPSPLPRAAQQD